MEIEKYIDRKDVSQFKVFNTTEIPFSAEVLKACEENLCGQYNTCWTCPPAVEKMLEIQKKIRSFEKAIIFTCKYKIKDFSDTEKINFGRDKTTQILNDIIQELKKEKINHLAYGCSSCKICEKCTFPCAPCRFPDKAIVPIEACGINVIELAEKLNISYYNGTSVVTFFCLIVY